MTQTSVETVETRISNQILIYFESRAAESVDRLKVEYERNRRVEDDKVLP